MLLLQLKRNKYTNCVTYSSEKNKQDLSGLGRLFSSSSRSQVKIRWDKHTWQQFKLRCGKVSLVTTYLPWHEELTV